MPTQRRAVVSDFEARARSRECRRATSRNVVTWTLVQAATAVPRPSTGPVRSAACSSRDTHALAGLSIVSILQRPHLLRMMCCRGDLQDQRALRTVLITACRSADPVSLRRFVKRLSASCAQLRRDFDTAVRSAVNAHGSVPSVCPFTRYSARSARSCSALRKPTPAACKCFASAPHHRVTCAAPA